MKTVVIGAGPAGCIAAIALASSGAAVTLIDEQTTVGGHLRYDPTSGPTEWREELVSALHTSGVQVLGSSVAWAAFRVPTGFEVMVTGPHGASSLACRHLVLAPGTTDRELMVEGGTLPGVMTERAARILFELHGVVPGDDVVIVGDQPDRTERLARDLQAAGVRCALLEPESVTRIDGSDGVESVLAGDGRSHPADVVVLACGERPDTQLAGMLEVPRSFEPEGDGWFVSGLDCGNGVICIGGALRGRATPAELVTDGLRAAGAILGVSVAMPESLPLSAGLLQEQVTP